MATPVTGQMTAYDLTNGVIVNMDEAIYMYSPEELPLLTGMGADGLSVLTTLPVDQYSFSWLDEDNLAPRSELEGAVTTGDTVITLIAGDRVKFSTGDGIYIRKAGASEILRITGYGTTADTLLVTRALVGTATNYADAAIVIGVGTALPEGSDPENARATDTNTSSNYTQIYGPTATDISGTAKVVPRYGVPDQWSKQIALRTYENAQSREQSLLYGRKYNSVTTKIRMSGGLAEFVTTNLDATSTQLSIAKLQVNQQSCFNKGGLPDRLIANPISLNDLNETTDTARVRQDFVDSRRGRQRVMTVFTEFGELTIVRDRWVHPFDAFGIRRDSVTRRILRPLTFTMLAKTGDSDTGMIVCEEGLEVKGERHMFRMNALVY